MKLNLRWQLCQKISTKCPWMKVIFHICRIRTFSEIIISTFKENWIYIYIYGFLPRPYNYNVSISLYNRATTLLLEKCAVNIYILDRKYWNYVNGNVNTRYIHLSDERPNMNQWKLNSISNIMTSWTSYLVENISFNVVSFFYHDNEVI